MPDQITIFIIEGCHEIQNQIYEEKYVLYDIKDIEEACSIGGESNSEWDIEQIVENQEQGDDIPDQSEASFRM